MAIAGMVLGIVGVIFAFIPVIGAFVSFPCIAVGLPLSIISFRRNNQQEQGTGMAVAGMATNGVALVLVVIWVIVLGAVMNEADEAFGSSELPSQSLPSSSADTPSAPLSTDPPETVRVDNILFYCADLLAEYRAMSPIGHDYAVMHVSNAMGLEAMERGDMMAYISVGEAQRALNDCQ